MKTKEELNALKEEIEALNKKLAELSEKELEEVSGGGGNLYLGYKCSKCHKDLPGQNAICKCGGIAVGIRGESW